ncbi:MAG: penicillin-insensitive murein endopeptidase [Myxococcales bacterium]|nr:penicillin-insensitive murein endopeptidase [Myxococcales bacterium]MCB9546045.1 penicillin-insensitive murein endopeptidase [Myxococcales bacterium]
MIRRAALLALLAASSAGATTPDRGFAPYGVIDGYVEALRVIMVTVRDSLSMETLIRHHPPAAVGRVQGRLLFGVQMQDSEGVWLRDRDAAWAVPETIDALVAAAAEVRRLHPGGMELSIGDISRRTGGRFPPHRTHQSGRDADMRYYLVDVQPGDREHHYTGVDNVDLPRQWTFIKTLIDRGQAEVIYMDYRHQERLYKYARAQGMTPEQLTPIFSYPRGKRVMSAVIQHMKNHFNHLHVRVFAPKSQLFGLLWTPAEAFALQQQVDLATLGHFDYVIRDGETLGKIARNHKVELADLMAWNGLGPRSKLRPGMVLKIRQKMPSRP